MSTLASDTLDLWFINDQYQDNWAERKFEAEVERFEAKFSECVADTLNHARYMELMDCVVAIKHSPLVDDDGLMWVADALCSPELAYK